MSRITFSSLPDDIIDRILQSLPDFTALYSAVTTSRIVYAVFQSHRSGIMAAVALSQIKPFEAALDLLRVQNGITGGPLQRCEEVDLLDNARVVEKLEEMFSRTSKDRRFRKSVLTPEESLRFQRATYLIWKYCMLFPIREDIENLREPERKDFLNGLSSSALSEMKAVHQFLFSLVGDACVRCINELMAHIDDPFSWTFRDNVISLGPKVVLQVAQTYLPINALLESDFDSIVTDRRFLLSNIDDTLKQRRIDPDIQFEIVEPIGWNDRCSRCRTQAGFNLWNHQNWDLLDSIIRINMMYFFLPGQLPYNTVETTRLETHLRTFDYISLFRSIFNLADSDEWSPEAWLCRNCVRIFLRKHLMKWWSREREKGAIIGAARDKPDCLLGFNCALQSTDAEHAAAYNHVCEDTVSQIQAI